MSVSVSGRLLTDRVCVCVRPALPALLSRLRCWGPSVPTWRPPRSRARRRCTSPSWEQTPAARTAGPTRRRRPPPPTQTTTGNSCRCRHSSSSRYGINCPDSELLTSQLLASLRLFSLPVVVTDYGVVRHFHQHVRALCCHTGLHLRADHLCSIITPPVVFPPAPR